MNERNGLIFGAIFVLAILFVSLGSVSAATPATDANHNNFLSQFTNLWNKLTGQVISPGDPIKKVNLTYNLSEGPVSSNLTRRIAYWWGKVNLHLENGKWVTDPDGVSGANLDKLEYCRKWYPNTISVKPYKMETITGWRNRGNVDGPFTSKKQTYECVQGNAANLNNVSFCTITYKSNQYTKASCKLYEGEFTDFKYGNKSNDFLNFSISPKGIFLDNLNQEKKVQLYFNGYMSNFSEKEIYATPYFSIQVNKIIFGSDSSKNNYITFDSLAYPYANTDSEADEGSSKSFCSENGCTIYANDSVSYGNGLINLSIPPKGIWQNYSGDVFASILINGVQVQLNLLHSGEHNNYLLGNKTIYLNGDDFSGDSSSDYSVDIAIVNNLGGSDSIGTCKVLLNAKNSNNEFFSCGLGDDIKKEIYVKSLSVDSSSKGSVVLYGKDYKINPLSSKLGVNDSWFTYDGKYNYLITVDKFVPASKENKAQVIFRARELNFVAIPEVKNCFMDKKTLETDFGQFGDSIEGFAPIFCKSNAYLFPLTNMTSLDSEYASFETGLFPNVSKLLLNQSWIFLDQMIHEGPYSGTDIDGVTFTFKGVFNEMGSKMGLFYILNPYNVGDSCSVSDIQDNGTLLKCTQNNLIIQGVKYISSDQKTVKVESTYPFKDSTNTLKPGESFKVYYPNGVYYGTFTFESFDGTAYSKYPNGTIKTIFYPVKFLANLTSFDPSSGKIVTPSCNGCSLGGKCYDLGYRINDTYCSTNGFVNQSTQDSVCQNNFECTSNLCINSKCVSGSLWNKLLDWFQKLFG